MTMINNDNANIIEIFSSVQGEGPYIGLRQIFIRFAFCNLNCTYCDTKFNPDKFYKVEEKPGTGIFKEYKNPANITYLIKILNNFLSFKHHSISLTGGEPLLHSGFLHNFLFDLKAENSMNHPKIYLETNGTLPDELNKIINYLDIISMDIKLESSTLNPVPWQQHTKFVDLAKANSKEIFAKVVITDNITVKEIEDLIEFFYNKKIPAILQPVNSANNKIVPSSQKLMNVQELMLEKLVDVRIIPQMHKYLNLL